MQRCCKCGNLINLACEKCDSINVTYSDKGIGYIQCLDCGITFKFTDKEKIIAHINRDMVHILKLKFKCWFNTQKRKNKKLNDMDIEKFFKEYL